MAASASAVAESLEASMPYTRGCLLYCDACRAPGSRLYALSPQQGRGRELKKCARCLGRAYCSADCQRADWRAGHKEECVAIQTRTRALEQQREQQQQPPQQPPQQPSSAAAPAPADAAADAATVARAVRYAQLVTCAAAEHPAECRALMRDDSPLLVDAAAFRAAVDHGRLWQRIAEALRRDAQRRSVDAIYPSLLAALLAGTHLRPNASLKRLDEERVLALLRAGGFSGMVALAHALSALRGAGDAARELLRTLNLAMALRPAAQFVLEHHVDAADAAHLRGLMHPALPNDPLEGLAFQLVATLHWQARDLSLRADLRKRGALFAWTGMDKQLMEAMALPVARATIDAQRTLSARAFERAVGPELSQVLWGEKK